MYQEIGCDKIRQMDGYHSVDLIVIFFHTQPILVTSVHLNA